VDSALPWAVVTVALAAGGWGGTGCSAAIGTERLLPRRMCKLAHGLSEHSELVSTVSDPRKSIKRTELEDPNYPLANSPPTAASTARTELWRPAWLARLAARARGLAVVCDGNENADDRW